MEFFEVEKYEDKIRSRVFELRGLEPKKRLHIVMDEQKAILSETMLKIKQQLEEEKNQLEQQCNCQLEEKEYKTLLNKLCMIYYKLSLLEKDFYDLTESESKIIGMENEYQVQIFFVYWMQAILLPVIPKRKQAYHYIYWEAKGYESEDTTLNDYVEFIERYVGMTYDEIMKDVKKMKSGKIK